MNHYLGGTLTAAFYLALGIALALPEPTVQDTAPSDATGPVDEPAAH